MFISYTWVDNKINLNELFGLYDPRVKIRPHSPEIHIDEIFAGH